MNIYKLSFKELAKLSNEFNKTAYGKKAFVMPMLLILMPLCIFLLIITNLKEVNIELFACILSVSVCLFAIVNMQYGNMLKDYYNLKK